VRRAALLAALAAALVGVAPASAALPAVRHVWVIVLENTDYAEAFESGKAPYLSRQLTAQGQLLSQYYGIAHNSQPNYVAMISGQAPNVETQADCQLYTEMLPGVAGPGGQAIGQGCVYPAGIRTLADQLTAKGLTWKGYMQDMGTPCRHPALNSRDDTQTARVGDQYAARHDPFVYFHSIIDTPACAAGVRDLDELQSDLTSPASSPSFALIAPNLCEDGHDEPCVDGRPGGVVSADQFLSTWVPRITTSAAYADGGLVVVTFDEAETGDASACCNEQPGLNTPNPGALTWGPGGGRTGAVLLSPFITPGTTNPTPYNHYSLLRSVEDLYGLSHLGFAAQPGLAAFGSDVFGG
jgi:phosphatidylinositol-3-phosphatase